MKWFVLLFALTAVIGCKSNKSTVQQGTRKIDFNWNLRYHRSPCFGKCPVYTVYIRDDGRFYMNSKANFLSPGWYYANVDKKLVNKLVKDLKASEFWNADFSDLPQIADLPSYSLKYKNKKEMHELVTDQRVSDDLMRQLNKLDDLIQGAAWKPSFDQIRDEKEDGQNIIVQLKPGVDIDKWLTKYAQYSPALVRILSPRTRHFLISSSAGSQNDFLQTARQDVDVVEAQMDRKTEMRNE